MKLREYMSQDGVDSIYLGNPIFDEYSAEVLSRYDAEINELEVKSAKKELTIQFGDEGGVVAQIHLLYFDEHKVREILADAPTI